MHRVAWTLLALALLAPTGAAASGGGSFLVEGGILLPQGSDLSFRPLLAFQPNTTSLTDLILRAPVMQVNHYSESFLKFGPADSGQVDEPRNDSFLLHDVEIRLRPESRGGMMGIHPGPTASSRLIAHAPTLLEASRSTSAASSVGADSDPDPYRAQTYYYAVAKGPHLAFEAPGLLLYEGPGVFHVMGPDLVAQAREGNYLFSTGESPDPSPQPPLPDATGPLQWVREWLIVTFENATLQMDATAPWVFATPGVQAEWDGRVVFSAREGELRTSDARYVTASPTLTRMDGRFLGIVEPLTSGGDVGARLDLQGDLVDSNLQRESIPFSARTLARGSFVTWGLLVVGAVAGLGGSLALGRALLRRKEDFETPPDRVFTVEECMEAANEAADEEDWPRVIVWLRRLRTLAPTSARACADLAHALRQSGDVKGALDLYDEASRLSEDGEADFNAAVLTLEMGRPLDDVEAWLERALWRSPAFVVDVEGDPVFQRLRGRPRFDRLVADAWARTEGEPDGGASSPGA